MLTIEKIWITDSEIWIRTSDGREACEKFADYSRLRYATPEQRANFTSDLFGIRWEELDEDLSFEGLFMAHPEINASAVARRLGISQSLLAQYIGGTKKPSKERLERIKSELRHIGEELLAI